MNSFVVHKAIGNEVPILVSVPHCGLVFPDEVKHQFKQALISSPDDTDWFVDKLYDFAPAMGITMITATYSRWVIDLNRDPGSKPLYDDGRIITALCPATTFLGESLYKNEQATVPQEEVNHRLLNYYWPYHYKLQELLDFTKLKFGKVLLWDCHSVRQSVPTIFPERFPDLILGDDNGDSCSPIFKDTALKKLKAGNYSVNYNFPFQGGFITRNYGKPKENQQALQLEMSKVNYMDDDEIHYHEVRAERMRDHLKTTFEKLIELLA